MKLYKKNTKLNTIRDLKPGKYVAHKICQHDIKQYFMYIFKITLNPGLWVVFIINIFNRAYHV